MVGFIRIEGDDARGRRFEEGECQDDGMNEGKGEQRFQDRVVQERSSTHQDPRESGEDWLGFCTGFDDRDSVG
jgi:hypothetical protein